MPAARASDDEAVTPVVRQAAAWSWRLLAILGAILAVLWLVAELKVILVPVAIAVMVTALMLPAVDWLDRRGAPRGGAVALVNHPGFHAPSGFCEPAGRPVTSWE